MKDNFWKKLNKPFFALAPMADVTDAAFRRIISKYGGLARTDGKRGGPDVTWTEMVSCDGLVSAGKDKLLQDLIFVEEERPIVAQFFGAKPENFYKCALLAEELGFDGIDINMGCPDRTINKQCAGASLINDPELAKKVIKETKRGAGKIPVSVKTRVGYNKEMLDEWMGHLLEAEPALITVHARTRKEMSLVPANWDLVKRAVELAKGSGTLIMGNGDVKSIGEARIRAKETGADGIMLGRAVFGNPWLFADLPKEKEPNLKERLEVMLEHAKLFEKLFKGTKNFAVMRKHFGSYVEGFRGAKDLRIKLMTAENADEVESILKSYL